MEEQDMNMTEEGVGVVMSFSYLAVQGVVCG